MDVKLKTSEVLLRKLAFGCLEAKLQAVSEIRLFAKWDDANRVSLAQAGAVPLLLELLHSSDSKMQENAITALLNLSINPQNKALIVRTEGGLEAVLKVIKEGISANAKANGAALLFSLVLDEELRAVVGDYGGVLKTLLGLLREGSSKCKADALKALYVTAMHTPLKAKLVEEQAVPLLVSLVAYGKAKLTEDCLAVLARLASCPEGASSLVHVQTAVPVVAYVLEKGSPRAQENAAGVLLNVCQSGGQDLIDHILDCKPCVPAISNLYWSGSDRGKAKAEALLKLLDVRMKLADPSSYSIDFTPTIAAGDPSYPGHRLHPEPLASSTSFWNGSWSKPWLNPAGKYISRARNKFLHRKKTNSTIN